MSSHRARSKAASSEQAQLPPTRTDASAQQKVPRRLDAQGAEEVPAPEAENAEGVEGRPADTVVD